MKNLLTKLLGLSTRNEGWVSLALWDACSGVVDEESLRGRTATAALSLDLANGWTGYALCFPPSAPDHLRYTLLMRAFPVALIEGQLRADAEKFVISDVCLDKWSPVALVEARALCRHGFKTFSWGLGFTQMSPPTKKLTELIVSGRLLHDGSAAMRAMALNTNVLTDPAGNIRPVARCAGKATLTVALMALGRALQVAPTL